MSVPKGRAMGQMRHSISNGIVTTRDVPHTGTQRYSPPAARPTIQRG
jgi:hypothetical protein